MDSIMPYHHQRVLETVEKCLARPNEVFQVKVDKPDENMDVKHTLWDFVCLTDEQGKPHEIQCCGIDVSERSNTEKKLQASEVRYRRLFETAKDGIILLNATTGAIEDVNPFLMELLGYSYQEFIGKELWEIGLFKDKVANKEAFLKLQEIGHVRYENLPLETRQGHPIWVEFVSNAYESDDKQVMQCNIRDITERHKTGELLTKINKELADYKFALDESAVVAVTDQHGIINHVNVNFCRISGYNESELIGRDHRMISSGHHSKEFIHDLWSTIASGKLWRGEFKNKAKDGSVYWVDTTIVPFLDEAGKPYQYVSIRSVITGRKLAEEALRLLNNELEERVRVRTVELTDTNKALEAFSYSVSLDLRAPVRAIMGFTKIILQDYGANMEPDLKELFGFIEDGGHRMSDLINDLLKLARYGKAKLKAAPVNMGELTRSIWANIERTEPNHVALELSDLPQLYADPSLIEQVLVNLISNAIKYSSKKEKPVLKIWCAETSENFTFFFQDNGAGFDMKNHHRLFGPFQRLHSVSDFEGTGIGLMLVKRIIEQHGGEVGANGVVGEGATFYFTLPKSSCSRPAMER